MIVKINHIGIAVENIEEAIKIYCDDLGLKIEEIETSGEQRVKVAMIPVGESKLELLEATDTSGPIGKFIEKRGEGIHHLALEVSDIEAMLGVLREKGVPLIDTAPRVGTGGTKIAFLHPKGTKVLIELVEA